MNQLSKIILTLAALIAIISFGTLFMPSTEVISSKQNIYFSINNAATLGRHGHLSNQGSISQLTLTTYNYRIKGSNYSGTSISFGNRKDPNKAYYIPFVPSISFINKGVQFVLILFLVIIGLGLKEIQNWLNRMSENQKL